MSDELTVDELFRRVIDSMNGHRYRPIPESEHAFIRQCCEEQLKAGYNADTPTPESHPGTS